MDPLAAFSKVCLTAFIIFVFFWIRTPSGEYYETVDRVRMQKKTAFGICAVIMLIGWIYLKTL